MPIKFEKVSHIYSDGSPFTYTALKNIDLEISEGKLTAIIGATGSGKSTLVQHLNALLLPSDGKVYILDRTIASDEKPTKLKSLRKDVGLVFQFPEYQLFEETIIKDVAFGPKNFDCSEEEALIKAKKALAMVNIDASFYDKSPLDLSGGQKRRVAIAGILAMDPKIIVLDEPTAGLDPQGAKAMMELFQRLNKQYQKTIIIVSHDMEHVFNYCDEVVVLDHGNVRCHLTVDEFFKDTKWCDELHIIPPFVIQAKEMLKAKGIDIAHDVKNVDELAQAIAKKVRK
ncbi:MAG: energy-coupling factor transporter ATPase [Erysipelotrichaceae bacterium]|nr:energy-coupling factor transporter ATPase [Erysipelotrichaceae bacterium]